MRLFLIVVNIILVPIIARPDDLDFWNGNIGSATIKLFLLGTFNSANYSPIPTDNSELHTKLKNKVQGYYLYDKYKKEIPLIGTILDGHWKFDEYDGHCINCKSNGYFDGISIGDTVSGFWESADRTKHIPFRIEKAPLLKRTVFGWLRGGVWALDGAEGFCGASTFTNLHKDEHGHWRAYGSPSNGPVSWDYQLSGEEKTIVDAIRIHITDSLELVVNVKDKEVIRIPYREDPLFTIRQTTTEIDSTGQIYKYQGQPGLTPISVNIATTDIGKFDDFLNIDALCYNIPSVAHIEYAITDDLFHITLMSKDCCANQELTFKKLSAPIKH